jgi:hypothetical protein
MRQRYFQAVEDIERLKERILQETINIFTSSYAESILFINSRTDLISIDDVTYELNNHISYTDGVYYVDYDEIDNFVIKSLYNTLVVRVMNKLVDDGILELCWDGVTSNFVWRKKKRSDINKWKKQNYVGRKLV